MKMQLSIKDRFVIPALFPQKSGLQNQIIVKDVVKKIEVSQKEREEINCQITPQGFKWADEKCKDKEIEFSESEICFLKSQIKRMDKSEEITLDMTNTCLKIKEIDLTEKKEEKKK